jgi:GR25 family glycosyltransferase involved in LPS biosynthesis
VSSVLRKHDAVVVVEDDIVLARNALQYFHQALHYYRHSGGVGSVSGYAHPPSLLSIPRHYPYDAYFLGRSFSWGWATWSDRWEQVNWDVSRWERLRQDERVVRGLSALGPDVPLMLDMQLNGKIDSWAIRYTLHHFLNGLLSLTPVHSYVQNIGLDGSGTHTGNTRRYENDLSLAMSNPLLPPFVAPNPLIAERFRRLYVQSRKARFKQLKRRAKRGAKQLIGRLRARDS